MWSPTAGPWRQQQRADSETAPPAARQQRRRWLAVSANPVYSQIESKLVLRMRKSSVVTALLLVALLVPLTGCLFRSHRVERQVSTTPLQTATQQQLIAKINNAAAQIRTLNATVDIATSVGGAKRGKVTEYKEIRGYVLVRKPWLRMIGLLPIVRNRAFDMVSDGETFKLWIPPTNKFYVGRNDVIHPAKNPMENIRPQVIYDALLLRAIDPKDEIAVLESSVEIVIDPKSHKQVEQPDYTLDVIQKVGQQWVLERKIVFSRTDLQPRRQIIYDKDGNLATDVRYGDFKEYASVPFPTSIQIWRPQEEYSINLAILKLTPNQALTDEQFALTQPAGAQVINLDTANVRAASGGK